jgi:hypothetical protein
MNGFLDELGRQLAARWAAMLVVPGLLYVAALVIAGEAGSLRFLPRPPVARLDEALTRWGVPGDRGLLLTVLLVAAAVLAAWAVGLAAQALAATVERVWSGLWPRWAAPVARVLTDRRQDRWDAANLRYKTEPAQASPPDGERVRDELAAARNRVALVRPSRPTWIGDRLHAADVRVWQDYGIDLTTCWSRLWLLIPDTARQAAQAARERYVRATLLGAWAMLYAVLGVLWLPSLLIAAVVGVVAWRQGRTTAAVLADLAEAIVDVHGRDLAAALAVPLVDDRITTPVGGQISQRVRKGA